MKVPFLIMQEFLPERASCRIQKGFKNTKPYVHSQKNEIDRV